jgi:hypothetical protein
MPSFRCCKLIMQLCGLVPALEAFVGDGAQLVKEREKHQDKADAVNQYDTEEEVDDAQNNCAL